MAQLIDYPNPKTFDFALEEGGKVYQLPLLTYLPFSFLRKMMTEKKEESFAFALIDEFCPEIQNDPLFTMGAASALFEAWKKASAGDGAEMGESSASPRS